MVDFSKLSRQSQSPKPIDPENIFLRLPKSPGVDDLWSGQAEALRQWFKRREERDIVVKLNTGGGKTLVGLLIAQSILNERMRPVLYLCPTRQLLDQILEQSKHYGIPAVCYTLGQELSEEFLAAKAVLIATYPALFNGLSRFGVSGTNRRIIGLGGIIFDDAHTAFSDIRDKFTLSISRNDSSNLYEEFATLFRPDFVQQSLQGTFDDVVTGHEKTILEIPYVNWANRAEEIRQRIAEIAPKQFPFVWPLIRNYFQQCHALISKDRFVITPFYPMVGLFPSFDNCPRRIYMSATFADDSSIIRTFDADFCSVSDPISPTSLAGVGERMILAPQLMPLPDDNSRELTNRLAEVVSKSTGVVILAPSNSIAKKWEDVATVVDGDNVAKAVNSLKDRSSNGPFAFPNRYDGIDLPTDSCRLLIISGLPQGSNEYDLFRAATLEGSGTLDTALAQRVEQGMGRGTRGGGDHCVVLLLGPDLVGWVSRASNLKLLTNTTQAQIVVGKDVSKEIKSFDQLLETMNQCLKRSSDWAEYHANALADATNRRLVDERSLRIATAERRYFAQVQSGNYRKATNLIEKFALKNVESDPKLKGWLLELGARSAHMGNDIRKREELQHEAYSLNKNLHRPTAQTHYTPLNAPTKQAERIVGYVEGFTLKRGALAEFERVVADLVRTATSNQFEEALKNFGKLLGFSAERPDKEESMGPDVLWLLNSSSAWIIEAKSRKKPSKGLSREEQGQLLHSLEWFRDHYRNLHGLGVVVHPNALATKSVTIGETMALTLPKLNELIGSARTLLKDLVSETMDRPTMEARCESGLRDLQLCPSQIEERYLSPFVSNEGTD